jgi:hypothetical protein
VRADPYSVGPQKVDLELVNLFRRDSDIDKLAKARVDAIDRLALGEPLLYERPRSRNARNSRGVQLDHGPMPGHGNDVIQREAKSVDDNLLIRGSTSRKGPGWLNDRRASALALLPLVPGLTRLGQGVGNAQCL